MWAPRSVKREEEPQCPLPLGSAPEHDEAPVTPDGGIHFIPRWKQLRMGLRGHAGACLMTPTGEHLHQDHIWWR